MHYFTYVYTLWKSQTHFFVHRIFVYVEGKNRADNFVLAIKKRNRCDFTNAILIPAEKYLSWNFPQPKPKPKTKKKLKTYFDEMADNRTLISETDYFVFSSSRFCTLSFFHITQQIFKTNTKACCNTRTRWKKAEKTVHFTHAFDSFWHNHSISFFLFFSVLHYLSVVLLFL